MVNPHDLGRLVHMGAEFLRIDPAEWIDSNPNKALQGAGVQGFEAEFIFLTSDDLLGLKVPPILQADGRIIRPAMDLPVSTRQSSASSALFTTT